MTMGSSMLAMMRTSPLHFLQVSMLISNPRFKRFAHVIALKTGFLQQMWRITIVPLLAVCCPKQLIIVRVRSFRKSRHPNDAKLTVV